MARTKVKKSNATKSNATKSNAKKTNAKPNAKKALAKKTKKRDLSKDAPIVDAFDFAVPGFNTCHGFAVDASKMTSYDREDFDAVTGIIRAIVAPMEYETRTGKTVRASACQFSAVAMVTDLLFVNSDPDNEVVPYTKQPLVKRLDALCHKRLNKALGIDSHGTWELEISETQLRNGLLSSFFTCDEVDEETETETWYSASTNDCITVHRTSGGFNVEFVAVEYDAA